MNTVSKDIIVNSPLEHVFEYWQDPANYPNFMENVQSVERSGNGRLHWKATAPDAKPVEWHSKMIVNERNKEMAWEWSSSSITSLFRVTFEEVEPEQTKITVQMDYHPPQPSDGATVKNFTDPADQLEKDLKSLKAVIEGS